MAARKVRRRLPSFRHEEELGAPAILVAGVDEVGRGPLAGPVVAAAVIVDPANLPRGLKRRINDSKQVPEPVREEIYEAVQGRIDYAIGQASVAEIDAINIYRASFLAMQRAMAGLPRAPQYAIVDGNRAPAFPCEARPVIGGDALCLSVALASIMAKVTRDRLMCELDARYPGYGWSHNAGYGTPEHKAGLLHLGVTPEHRTSFRFVSEVLSIRT
jgi:ribonuclease HII